MLSQSQKNMFLSSTIFIINKLLQVHQSTLRYQQFFCFSMRLFFAKALISCILLYQVYLLTYRQVSRQAILKVLALNIDAFSFHSQNTQFLKSYLHIIIIFCFSLSALVIISKNLLPKFLVIVGIILWMLFGFHPSLDNRNMTIQRGEYMAVIGGLLYIGGCQYFQKDISFIDFSNCPPDGSKTNPSQQ